MRIADITLSFFDTETTGINPYLNDHRIVQAAVIQTRGGEIINTFQTLINPERPIPDNVIPIHGITDDMVEGAPLIAEVLPELLDHLRNTYVVIHNAPFDLEFLDAALQENDFSPLRLSVVDTLKIARCHMRFPSNSLRRIARWYGIGVPDNHRALEDADILRRIFSRFLDELRIETTEGLERLRGVDHITIGKAPFAPDI